MLKTNTKIFNFQQCIDYFTKTLHFKWELKESVRSTEEDTRDLYTVHTLVPDSCDCIKWCLYYDS